jgi:hypothetical protein
MDEALRGLGTVRLNIENDATLWRELQYLPRRREEARIDVPPTPAITEMRVTSQYAAPEPASAST